MSRARAALGLTVFLLGMAAGFIASRPATPQLPDSPWASLPTVEEPATSRALVAMLPRDDARGLARALDIQLLERLAGAIDPLVDVEEVTFTGATERQGDILSAYIAEGKALSGERLVVGIVFRVRDGRIVGVN